MDIDKSKSVDDATARALLSRFSNDLSALLIADGEKFEQLRADLNTVFDAIPLDIWERGVDLMVGSTAHGFRFSDKDGVAHALKRLSEFASAND